MAHHHLIPGNPGRKLSDRYGLVVPLCPRCHELVHSGSMYGTKALHRLVRYGQLKAMEEQGWTEDEFRAVFGKSYI
jgi:hypothetical protein